MTTQLGFDLDTLIREADRDAAPAWDGAPLKYHESYYPAAELEAAFERYTLEHGTFASVPNSHMWKFDGHTGHHILTLGGHQLHFFKADTRCSGRFTREGHHHTPGELPDELMTMLICEPCQWYQISHDERTLVYDWHDHALPGWRTLPVIPQTIARQDGSSKAVKRLAQWATDNYPANMQQPGYPILTQRDSTGTRHIPGRSPFGGYDLIAPEN